MKFKEWLNLKDPTVDSSDIERVYNKAKAAVDLVRMYDPSLLYNITTIANLDAGAYGLYNSGENENIVDPSVEPSLIYTGKVNKQQLNKLPRKILKQYFPGLQNKMKPGDTIHVNVRRILSQAKSDMEAIIQIASTIVHESTHEIEKETRGFTSEAGPMAAERRFQQWVSQNMDKFAF